MNMEGTALDHDAILDRITGAAPLIQMVKTEKPFVDLREGDCREVLKELDDDSVDAVVTDPPYALTSEKKGGTGPASLNLNSPAGRARVTTGFMGKAWDTGETAFDPAFWQEVLRVLKPGGHVLAFGGSRTYHKIATAIDDAGFEIRDQIMWIYGSGFPKSSNQKDDWEGWGTALKPAHEPIVVARKPLIGTVPANLAKYGVGALNIDGCRVETEENLNGGAYAKNSRDRDGGWQNDDRSGGQGSGFRNGGRAQLVGDERRGAAAGMFQAGKTADADYEQPEGRWPANVIHDGSDEVLAHFPESKDQQGDVRGTEPSHTGDENTVAFGEFGRVPFAKRQETSTSAARFFYCAKTSKADRDDGLTTAEQPVVTFATANGTSGKPSSISEGRNTAYKNTHPTVKPTDLMRYLTRLVTPPGGTVLDPFMGSGSTGRGAVLEGFNFIGIEMDAGYYDIADARIAAAERKVGR